MPRSLALSSLLVLAALIGLSSVPASLAQEATPGGDPAPLAWTQCEGGDGWECAVLATPLDYADPDGPTIDLALTRLPASDPERRIGALVFNVGGPGGATVSFLHEAGALIFPEETLAQFDLVGFDPRGVGASAPIDCQIDWPAYFALDPSPDDAAERQAWLEGGRDYAAACAANAGALLPFMDTESVVSDMERLRVALGEEQLSFLGLSYGTSLGARYADRYPDRVRAFALDSALPPFIDGDTLVPQWANAAERSFDVFLADCAAALTCPFSSGGNPGAAFDALMVALDAQPLAVDSADGPRLVGQHAVLDAIDVTLSKPPRWPQLAAALASAAGGDGAPVLALADQRNGRLPDGSYAPGNEAFLAVSCLDFALPSDAPSYEALAAKTAMIAPRLGAYYATWTLPCAFWPAPAALASHEPDATGAPPILVIGATVDTQDPYQWSVDMAAQLESGVLLTREGTGHPSYLNSACVEDAVNAYLVDLVLPPADLICSSHGGLFERFA